MLKKTEDCVTIRRGKWQRVSHICGGSTSSALSYCLQRGCQKCQRLHCPLFHYRRHGKTHIRCAGCVRARHQAEALAVLLTESLA